MAGKKFAACPKISFVSPWLGSNLYSCRGQQIIPYPSYSIGKSVLKAGCGRDSNSSQLRLREITEVPF